MVTEPTGSVSAVAWSDRTSVPVDPDGLRPVTASGVGSAWPFVPFEPICTRYDPCAGTVPASLPTDGVPVFAAARYWIDHPSTATAVSVGFAISTNLFVNGWFALPPFRYASAMTRPAPAGSATAVETETSGAATSVAATVAHSTVRRRRLGMLTFGRRRGTPAR